MFKEIEILESLIQDKLCVLNNLSEDELAESHSFVQNFASTVRQSIMMGIFEIKEERLIIIYIQELQSRLISLSNILYLFADSSGSQTRKALNGSVLKLIDDTISWIQHTFSQYFNFDSIIPFKRIDECVIIFSEKITRIKSIVNIQDVDLLQIALQPFNEFILAKTPLNYHQLNYLNLLVQEIDDACELQDWLNLETRLIFISFNTNSFLYYITQKITRELKELDSLCEKLERLYWYCKWIRQINTSQYTYLPMCDTLKDLVSEWIAEEINFLEKTLLLSKSLTNESKYSDQKFKLETDLSVPQLAFMLRIFLDAGIFKNKNQKAVVRFFAENTTTKRGLDISQVSLLNKFYNHDGNVIVVVKSQIIKMLNFLNNFK